MQVSGKVDAVVDLKLCSVFFHRRHKQTKPVYQQWRGHCATTGHFLYILKWVPGVCNLIQINRLQCPQPA